MDLILQIWGGSFYLANKIFLALGVGKESQRKRRYKIIGWAIYLLGAPAWVIILTVNRHWIAASIEAGGVPSMLFGLYNVCRRSEKPNRLFDIATSLITYTFVIFGVAYSLYDYGGITSVSQMLEMGIMVGFLLGSYLLAKSNTFGWLFFMLMNGSMGSLMAIQNKPILAIQQAISLCFVIYGFVAAIRFNRYKISIMEQNKPR